MSEEKKNEVKKAGISVYEALELLGTTKVKDITEEGFLKEMEGLTQRWQKAVNEINTGEVDEEKKSLFEKRLTKVENTFRKLSSKDFSVLEDPEKENVIKVILKKLEDVKAKMEMQFKKKEKAEKEQADFGF